MTTIVRAKRRRTCRDLVGEVDPYVCTECLSTGEACLFHVGYAEGFDACLRLMASGSER